MSRKSPGNIRRWASAREFLRIANSPVLNCESGDDFNIMRRALEYEVDPQGFVQEMYVSDIAGLVWEMLRLRRCKKERLNREYWDKLYDILKEQCTEYDEPEPGSWVKNERVDEEKLQRLWDLADGWFTDENVRKKISELLGGYIFDDAEIEMSINQEPSELIDALDSSIAALEYRRDKALRCIAEYRYSFAAKIKESVNSIIDNKPIDVPRLEHKAAKKSAA